MIGIKRKRCIRCGERAHAQWDVCALGNRKLPVCKACDVGLNRSALEYMRIPGVSEIMAAYEQKMLAQ
jgi:NAD-dependent SIR2 family protein deacetylase